MTRRQMLRALAVRQGVALPWYARMLLWSHLRGTPYGHARTCHYVMLLKNAGEHFDFEVNLQ